MVRIKDPENYQFIRYEKSNTKNAMYDAIHKHKSTGKLKRVPFGDKNYQNYRDLTGLNLYPHLIHKDKNRRKKYRARHAKNAKYKYSSAWYSYNKLW